MGDNVRMFWFEFAPSSAQQTALKDSLVLRRGRLTPAEEYHITVAYLGDIEVVELAQVRSSVGRAAHAAAPIDVTLDRLELFHSSRIEPQPVPGGEGSLLYATTRDPRLQALVHSLRSSIHSVLGTMREEYWQWRPHVTLAKWSTDSSWDGAALARPVTWTIDRVHLCSRVRRMSTVQDRSDIPVKRHYTWLLEG